MDFGLSAIAASSEGDTLLVVELRTNGTKAATSCALHKHESILMISQICI